MDRQWCVVQPHADPDDRPHVFGPFITEESARFAMDVLEELLGGPHTELEISVLYGLNIWP